nr:transposase [Lamprobacter modestohalophilus]
MASSISIRLPLRRTVTSTVTSSSERRITCVTFATLRSFKSKGYSVLLKATSLQGCTPKHASWLNQIEMWFSILARKVIRRGNFLSVDDLHEKLANFIDFFNDKLAKPFRWTYTGKPLAA